MAEREPLFRTKRALIDGEERLVLVPQVAIDQFPDDEWTRYHAIRRIGETAGGAIVHSWAPDEQITDRAVELEDCYGDLWLASAELKYLLAQVGKQLSWLLSKVVPAMASGIRRLKD